MPRKWRRAKQRHRPLHIGAFVPADRPEAWPRDGDKFIPVELRDFDAWVAAINHTSSGPIRPAIIDAAEYTGRLEPDGRFHGQGHWNISLPSGQPAFLPLDRMSLIIRHPRWQCAAGEPVRIGDWGAANAEPDLSGLEVPRSDVLEFDWSVPGSVQSDAVEIPWRLPVATSTRLVLDLPEGKRPRIVGAAVLDSTLLPTDTAGNKRRRRWTLAVSPASDATLHISASGRDSTDLAGKITLHEESSYHVEQRGLDIVATWNLDGPMNKQRELSVPLPRGAQLSSVVSEGHELVWRVARGASPVTDNAIISLPNSPDQRSLRLVLSAWHPLVVDRPWQLPVLRPDGAFVSEGKFELSIDPQFELRNLNPIDCVQTAANLGGSGGDDQATYSLLSYSPTSALEVMIVRRKPETSIRAGSSLMLADPDVTGRLVTEWSVAHSGIHRLSGEIAAGWNVETVETVPLRRNCRMVCRSRW